MELLITQQLLERLASLLRSETRNLLTEYGLQPVQFEALNYLSMSNRYSDTPMAVTEFLGQTKGTVSQTLKVLEKKGLVTKAQDAKDKRVTHLTVTDEGKQLISTVLPSPLLMKTADAFADGALEEINVALMSLLRTFQASNSFKSFGQCDSCVHNKKTEDGAYFCGLTQEALSVSDVKLICREHEEKIV